MKRGILVFILAAICALAFMAASGTYKEVIGSLTGTMTFDSTLDTAAVVRAGGYSALDSFDYVDSLLAGKTEVKWTSPLYQMILTPTVSDSGVYEDTFIFPSTNRLGARWVSSLHSMYLTPTAADSGIYEDTTILASGDRLGVRWVAPVYQAKVTFTSSDNGASYVDTIDFASDQFLVSWTADGSNTEAEMCDSLVSKVNALADLTDSINAEDSTSFVVLRSLYSEANLATWTVAADTAQTVATKVEATVAMVCDSLTALIEAATDLTDSVKAEDSATFVKKFSLFSSANYGGRWTSKTTANIDTSSAAETATLAMVCDTLTAFINAEANLTDTVTAEDSATYIKVAGLYSSDTHGGRWTVKTTAGIDTASHANIATIAMVTDSMVATINAKAVVTDSMTAANTGDTAYTLTMDNTGQALNLKFGDTAQDSTWLVLNKADWSTMTAVTKDIGRADGFNSLRSQIVMNNVQTTDAGISLADTGKLWLYSGFAGTYVLIDSSVTAGLPCSLNTVLVQAIGDSAIRPSLRIKYQLKDSTTDTSFSASFPVSWKIFLK